MKTKLLSLLFVLLPIGLFSQNYEKEGDELFAQTQYEQAEKKYKAAIAISGESQTIKQKRDNCSKCKSLLVKAETAEKESRYSDAAKHYSDLYAIHSLAKYQSKANALKQKIQKLEQQRLAKIEEEKRVERERQAKLEEERAKLKGYCGNNISYEYYAGKLTLSGRGEMNNFSVVKDIPWYERKDEIKTILISDGIKSIADRAFSDCTNLTSVCIPQSVTRIGNYAFANCIRLQTIYIPKNVDKIGKGAFFRCYNLSITLPERFRDTNVGQKDCKIVTYYSKESESLQDREWIRVSSIRTTNNSERKLMFPRYVEFNKMRVSFSKVSSPQYCYIRICYSDTKGVALEFAFQSTPRYYINGKLQPDSFVSRGRRTKDQIYEYDLNELCGTSNKKFIIESWQENFLPEQVEIKKL